MKKMSALVMVCLMSAAVFAASIPVTNFSFEQPGAGKIKGWNGESGTDIPGWASDTAVADSGVESDWPGSTDGVYSGFMMSGDPAAWNLTSYVIAAGDVFTLQVDARDNWTNGGLADFQIALYYDVAGVRNIVASTVAADISQTWTTYSLTFAADAASVGNLIGIELKNVDPATNSSWMGMDNVRLDVVPEPATMLLLGLGGIMALKKGKK